MVASRQVETPFYTGVGRQRGMWFGAFAKIIGRSVIYFLSKFNVPAAKGESVDLLKFAAPEIAEVVSGKEIQNSCKECRKTDLEKTAG